MNFGWRPSSVRLRLALWYSAAVALVLLIYAAGVYVFVRNSLTTELDRALHDDFEIVEQLLDTKASDKGAWAEAKGHHEGEGDTVRWMEVWSPPGNLRFRSASMAELPVPASVPTGYDYRSVRTSAGMRVRTLVGAHAVGSSQFVVRVTRSEERVAHELNELLAGLGLGLPIAMICAGMGGYHLAKRTLKPVGSMTEQARSITADQLRTRMPVHNPDDELGHLAIVFNDLLGRIEEAFDRLKRFTADASHELRTPLTAIRSVGEVGLREPRDGAAYREVIGSMLEEADRLTRLVDSLLFLSRADSAHARVNREWVELAALAREVAGHLSVLAEDRSQSIVIDAGAAVNAEVDPVLVREALINIVDNAIKYSPAGSTITIRVARMGGEALIAVADQGPGVPHEYRERIFHRFFRVDEARTRDRGGAGLGLAIAKWAVDINGGSIVVDQLPGGGSEFRILLPIAAPDTATQARRT